MLQSSGEQSLSSTYPNPTSSSSLGLVVALSFLSKTKQNKTISQSTQAWTVPRSIVWQQAQQHPIHSSRRSSTPCNLNSNLTMNKRERESHGQGQGKEVSTVVPEGLSDRAQRRRVDDDENEHDVQDLTSCLTLASVETQTTLFGLSIEKCLSVSKTPCSTRG